jgi:hypothetical protein
MSRPIKKRENYLNDTIALSRIIAATQLDDSRSDEWKNAVLTNGQKLINLLNDGGAAGGSEQVKTE